MPASKRQHVILNSKDPHLTLRLLLGEAAPVVTSGYGGWEVVGRPRRQGLTEWRGREPYRLSLDLLIDNFEKNTSIERLCSTLERMAVPPRAHAEPPVIDIDGAVPHSDLDWVIDTINWGDSIRNRDGHRVRQKVTVIFLRYVDDDRVKQLSAAERRRRAKAAQKGRKKKKSKKSTSRETYTVKSGDTLSSIAAQELGDWQQWEDIADANDLRDPDRIEAGTVIQLP